jgi:hypothetical protein
MLPLTSALDHSGQSAPRPGCFACRTGGWAGPKGVWTGAENLAFTGIQSPDFPTSGKLLCELRCQALQYMMTYCSLMHIEDLGNEF